MAELDQTKLEFLSPDNEEWSDSTFGFRMSNCENAMVGVLVYPNEIEQDEIEDAFTEFIEGIFGDNEDLTIDVKIIGDQIFVPYCIVTYNHFNLAQCFDITEL